MDKKLLSDYIDACAMVKETEQEIKKLKQKKIKIAEGVVKGSNPEFPYQPRNFHIHGTEFGYADDMNLRRKEKVLEERKKRAEEIKTQTEEWMNSIPLRMQRIVKYKIFEGLSWEETAGRLGRKANGDSLRMEFHNFMKKIK
ncbi:hypothetical protein C806_00079 [Lachnospiraceae bacterium 3-1]|nr:hypothetical protein C806_00079 [Lachnospiraceae bacterium 3-1]